MVGEETGDIVGDISFCGGAEKVGEYGRSGEGRGEWEWPIGGVIFVWMGRTLSRSK